MAENNDETDELIRKLHKENADLRQKVEFLTSLVGRVTAERNRARDKGRYHDPEDRSWRAWSSNDAAE